MNDTIIYNPRHREQAKFFIYDINTDMLGIGGTPIEAYYILPESGPLFVEQDVLMGTVHRLVVTKTGEPRPSSSILEGTYAVLNSAWICEVELVVMSDRYSDFIPSYLLDGKYLQLWDGKSDFEVLVRAFTETGDRERVIHLGKASHATCLLDACQQLKLPIDKHRDREYLVDDWNRPSILGRRLYDREELALDA